MTAWRTAGKSPLYSSRVQKIGEPEVKIYESPSTSTTNSAASAAGTPTLYRLCFWIATLVSTTRLCTLFKLLPSFKDQITKRCMTPHKPLPKGFHLYNEGTTLCEFFVGYLFLFAIAPCSTITVTGVPLGRCTPSSKITIFPWIWPLNRTACLPTASVHRPASAIASAHT